MKLIDLENVVCKVSLPGPIYESTRNVKVLPKALVVHTYCSRFTHYETDFLVERYLKKVMFLHAGRLEKIGYESH